LNSYKSYRILIIVKLTSNLLLLIYRVL